RAALTPTLSSQAGRGNRTAYPGSAAVPRWRRTGRCTRLTTASQCESFSSQALRRLHHLLPEPDLARIAVVSAMPNHGERDRRKVDGDLKNAQPQGWRNGHRQSLGEGGDHLRIGYRPRDGKEMRNAQRHVASTVDGRKRRVDVSGRAADERMQG